MSQDSFEHKAINPSSRSLSVNGERLRSLRTGRGWTQEEAAEIVGVSDRLIRKAEAGRTIGIESLRKFAAAYSTSEHPLSPGDLLLAAPEVNRLLLKCWLDKIWNHRQIDAIDELATSDVRYRCEAGNFLGRGAVRQRVSQVQSELRHFQIIIDRINATEQTAVCRWRMIGVPDSAPATNARATRRAFSCNTLMTLDSGRIREISEFRMPSNEAGERSRSHWMDLIPIDHC
jgi:transcriptional regulator with XRE-family HTH domain